MRLAKLINNNLNHIKELSHHELKHYKLNWLHIHESYTDYKYLQLINENYKDFKESIEAFENALDFKSILRGDHDAEYVAFPVFQTV